MGLYLKSLLGESHGGGIGVVIDGCPPSLPLSENDIQPALDRRRPGQSKLTTPRDESDKIEILSGTFEGYTLGTPIAMLARNKDARPQAYDEMKTNFAHLMPILLTRQNMVSGTMKAVVVLLPVKQLLESLQVRLPKKYSPLIMSSSQHMLNEFITSNLQI